MHLQLGQDAAMRGFGAHRAGDYLTQAGGLDVRNAAALVMAPEGRPEETRRLNDLVLQLHREDERWLPLCSVHPHDGDAALAEIDRVAEAGAKGFKLHPNTQAFDLGDERVAAVVQRIATHGVPVLFDGYSPVDPFQPGKFVKLSMGVPDAQIIIAHALGQRFAELMVYDVLTKFPDLWSRNIWVDLSFSGALYADSPFREQFAWSIRRVGVDRLLLGSDYPLGGIGSALAALDTLGFTADEQRAIAHDNAVKLFGLDV
ncbi:amidohydrolase family protein [Kribbella sp. HUAS MG21]|uniref:Amidohydrolase family protein n=1 Tax=Kribbella sp. HUAS MG21 TaxID=3160966 RepID=A0AAU7TBQ2_9ACTN